MFLAALLVSAAGFPLSAQQVKPPAESSLIQELLLEVRQLRMALERSSLVVPRLQLVMQKIQLQQGRVDRIARQLEDLRVSFASWGLDETRLSNDVKAAEGRVGQAADPLRRKELEERIKQAKAELDQQAARIQQQRTREIELANQLQVEQGRLDDLASQLALLEKLLAGDSR
jgi:hypothetical protein